MSINAKALERGFWDNVSFKDKTGELLAIATNMNWSFAELAEQVGVSEERLDNLITFEEVDDELVTGALLKLLPVAERRLQEHKRNLEQKIDLSCWNSYQTSFYRIRRPQK
ncbi:hypothetical protein JZO70_16050 [Enterococcus sp. 669A]|uniref:Uncharacterized protein n=1 Tax=Candidatus Enterococcus moelleringii TaxID=2815325 RepID=A0ABS3LDI8_9ENTE|nr:hypothetical protein [Enterococcus sp. 669A]MBO1307690.1 hypothetical protein [Enterococcus sp. 669A]